MPANYEVEMLTGNWGKDREIAASEIIRRRRRGCRKAGKKTKKGEREGDDWE